MPFANLLRRIERCINPPPPVLMTVDDNWKFKVESFPIRIQDDIQRQSFILEVDTYGKAMRVD